MADYIFAFVIPLVAFLAIIWIPTVTSIIYATCNGGIYNQNCQNVFSTKCCSSGIFGSATCCSPRSRTSCYDGSYTYRYCSQYTHSKCCYLTVFGSSSCCDYYDYSRTSRSRYSSSTITYYYTPLGAIVGGVIGGLVFLVLLIVIPVVACGVCAAGANRRGRQGQVRQTTVVTHQTQPMQAAYVNQGYAPPTYGQAMPPQGPEMPPPGPSQPPTYNQAVMLSGPGHAGAPPTAAMYPQPGGQDPPPTTVNPPQYPPPGARDAKNMTTSY